MSSQTAIYELKGFVEDGKLLKELLNDCSKNRAALCDFAANDYLQKLKATRAADEDVLDAEIARILGRPLAETVVRESLKKAERFRGKEFFDALRKIIDRWVE